MEGLLLAHFLSVKPPISLPQELQQVEVLVGQIESRVSDMDFGLATLHALISVTTGAKPRNAPRSPSLSAGDLSLACRG
jgi:hypothetical protein